LSFKTEKFRRLKRNFDREYFEIPHFSVLEGHFLNFISALFIYLFIFLFPFISCFIFFLISFFIFLNNFFYFSFNFLLVVFSPILVHFSPNSIQSSNKGILVQSVQCIGAQARGHFGPTKFNSTLIGPYLYPSNHWH